MVVAGFLEMLSIGIMIPLVNIIFNPEGTTNEVFSSILKSSRDSLSLNYISISILAIFFVYLLKYLFLVFYTGFKSKVLLVRKADL